MNSAADTQTIHSGVIMENRDNGVKFAMHAQCAQDLIAKVGGGHVRIVETLFHSDHGYQCPEANCTK